MDGRLTCVWCVEDDTRVGADKLFQELHVLWRKWRKERGTAGKPSETESAQSLYIQTSDLHPSVSLQMLPSLLSQF